MLKFLIGLPFSNRQRKLANSRSSIDTSEFVSRIAAQGGDERAAEIIWRILNSSRVAAEFTPYPEDSLERVYGIAEEELDEDLISQTLNELELPLPDSKFVKKFGVIDSPLRIAQLVQEWRRLTST